MFDNFQKRSKRGVTSLTPFDLIEDALSNVVSTAFGPLTTITSSIKVDVKETESEYILDAEIPGVEKEDIQVNLKDNILSLDVIKEESKAEVEDNYILKERKSTTLSRSFYIENIDTDGIKAKYINGILTLTLPKIVQETDNCKNINID